MDLVLSPLYNRSNSSSMRGCSNIKFRIEGLGNPVIWKMFNKMKVILMRSHLWNECECVFMHWINLPPSGLSLCLLLLPLQLLLGVILSLQHDPALGSHGGGKWVVVIFKFVTNWLVINLRNVISPKLWRHLDKITNCQLSSVIYGQTFNAQYPNLSKSNRPQ